jgi:NitT/TauT family transport system substrate-binding protein
MAVECALVKRALVLALCGVLTVYGPAIGQQSAPSTTIRVGALPQEVSAEIFYGLDMGFFSRQGLDVQLTLFSNGSAIAAGVASGSLDVGLSDLISIISAHARGVPFVYIAPGLVQSEKAPAFGIVVRGDSKIRGPKDMNGKTFGVNGLNNISVIPTRAWIDRNGGDSKTIKWVEIPMPSMQAALAQGTVDATLPNEPALSASVAAGNRAIFMDKNAIAPVYLLSGWVTTREWIAKNPETARRFVAAIRETAEWANQNHAASAPILSKYTKIPESVITHMHRANFAEAFDPALIQPVIDAAAKYGVIPKAFPATEIYYAGR